MKFDILKRFNAEVILSMEIDAKEDDSHNTKLGMAVRAAVKRGADLRGAYLGGADLKDADLKDADLKDAYLGGAYLEGADLKDADLKDADLKDAYLGGAYLGGAYLEGAYLKDAYLGGAYLGGAYLEGADLIDGGQRSDGYRFIGQVRYGVLWIHAGCRYFPIEEARKHWMETRAGTSLGEETFARLNMIEAVAKIRGLLKQ